MPLDLDKLLNVRPSKNGSRTAQCPACAEHGRDQGKNHLLIYPTGKFGCGAHHNDSDHRSRIWALAGDGSKGGGGEAAAPRDQPSPQVELPASWPVSVLDRLIKDYSYWEGRGISEETVAPFRGGVATQFQMKDRWVFPQFNEHEEIIGFSGRCVRKMSREDRKKFNRPAWKHLTPSSGFVWGGLDEIEESGRAILVESIGDGLALREHGVPENLCIFGTTLQPVVLGRLIALNPREIIVATNNDVGHHTGQNVGRLAAQKIEKALLSFFDRKQVRILLPSGENVKDCGDMALVPEAIEFWKSALDSTDNPASVE